MHCSASRRRAARAAAEARSSATSAMRSSIVCVRSSLRTGCGRGPPDAEENPPPPLRMPHTPTAMMMTMARTKPADMIRLNRALAGELSVSGEFPKPSAGGSLVLHFADLEQPLPGPAYLVLPCIKQISGGTELNLVMIPNVLSDGWNVRTTPECL